MGERELKNYIAGLEKDLANRLIRAARWREIAEGLQNAGNGERVQTSGEIYRMEVAICEAVQLEEEAALIRERLKTARQKLKRLHTLNEEKVEMMGQGLEKLAVEVCKRALDDYRLMHIKPKWLETEYRQSRMPLTTARELREFIKSDMFYYYSGGLDGEYILSEMDKILNVSYSE